MYPIKQVFSTYSLWTTHDVLLMNTYPKPFNPNPGKGMTLPNQFHQFLYKMKENLPLLHIPKRPYHKSSCQQKLCQ